jgi:8-oxo-dGTP diphosphatase
VNPEHPLVVVLAAIIEEDGRYLVTRRPAGTHLSGLWEFPGGKCEAGETPEGCLARELEEELGIDAEVGPEILETTHRYADRTVRLHFRRCAIRGTPRPRLGQAMRWVAAADLAALDFPEADRELIDLLTTSPRS